MDLLKKIASPTDGGNFKLLAYKGPLFLALRGHIFSAARSPIILKKLKRGHFKIHPEDIERTSDKYPGKPSGILTEILKFQRGIDHKLEHERYGHLPGQRSTELH